MVLDTAALAKESNQIQRVFQALTLSLPCLKPFDSSPSLSKKKKKSKPLALVFVAFQDLGPAYCSILILTKEANAVIQQKEPEAGQRRGDGGEEKDPRET